MSTATRHRPAHEQPAGHRPVSHRLEASLAEWEDAGLIAHEQAAAIREFEVHASSASRPPAAPALGAPTDVAAPAPAGPTRRVPVVAEALGYLGGMLGVIGAVLLTSRSWSSMVTATRLGVAVAACVVLLVGGAVIPKRGEPALERLRSFLWLGATAAGGLAGGVYVNDIVLDADDAVAAVLGGAFVVAVLSLLLWWQKERPVQQATFLIGALVTVGTLSHQLIDTQAAGVAVWVLGMLFLVSGIAHMTTSPWITVGVGGAGMVVGAALAGGDATGPSLLFWTATAGLLLALAMIEEPVRTVAERVVLYVVGGVGLLQSFPPLIAHFGVRAGIATGIAVMATGFVLLVASQRPIVRAQVLAQLLGGALLVGGAAITGMQSVAFATAVGLATAACLIVLGTIPGFVPMSIFGCLGLLINVPWAISHFFPGEGRAPLLIAVSGLLIVLVAVWLSHQGGELRHTFRRRRT